MIIDTTVPQSVLASLIVVKSSWLLARPLI